MRQKKPKPPPDGGGTYIEPNRRSAAIPSNGIAALFHSTNIIVIAFDFTNITNILFARVSVFRWARAFLFPIKTDKPGHYRPRCRSPPALRFDSHQLKSKWRKRQMQNFTDSDYALNKHSEGIVYRFSDRIVEVTLADYLAENPGKTDADFAELKALSDSDYFEQDRNGYRQTWKNVPFNGVEETEACAASSPEDEVTERPERIAKEKQRQKLAKQVLDKLSDVQRRRYLLYHVKGLNEREIAKKEGSTQQAISKSLYWAEKKIKKFLSGAKK